MKPEKCEKDSQDHKLFRLETIWSLGSSHIVSSILNSVPL